MFVRPPEWQKPKTLWLAWPYDQALWAEDLALAQQEFVALVMALAGQKLVVIFPDQEELNARAALFAQHRQVALKAMPYGDIWLRDTLPVFVKDSQGHTVGVIPQLNGWGQKYLFEADLDLSLRVAHELGVPTLSTTLVFEGGAIECDGQGTLITTEQCLLNKNRNPGWTKSGIEAELARLFGVTKIIWLKEGLKNDHTDGHVDTIARFIGPGQVAVMVPRSADDPNYEILGAIRDQLAEECDALGHKLSLVELPSPGRVLNSAGAIMPASFVNFIIGDEVLVMPSYGSAWDDEALRIIAQKVSLKVVGLSARAILTGGGAFHCISQEIYE